MVNGAMRVPAVSLPVGSADRNATLESPVSADSVKSKANTYPRSRIKLVDRFIDEPRELRVGVIGGGLSGILAGILLPAKVPGIKLTIIEKNHDFVGNCI